MFICCTLSFQPSIWTTGGEVWKGLLFSRLTSFIPVNLRYLKPARRDADSCSTPRESVWFPGFGAPTDGWWAAGASATTRDLSHSLWEMLQWPSCRIITRARTHTLPDTIIVYHSVCVNVCVCSHTVFSLLRPVQMEGLPFLTLVKCPWICAGYLLFSLCLSPSFSPSLHPLLPSPCLFHFVPLPVSSCSPFCLSLLLILPSHPPCLLLSLSLSSPSLPPSPCVSLSVVRKLQEFELPYVSISSLQSSDFHILLRKRYWPPAHITIPISCTQKAFCHIWP